MPYWKTGQGKKVPVSALHSIAQSLESGPVAIYDVMDDPRIQYPKEAQKEGISSILVGAYRCRGKINGSRACLYI